VTTQTAAPRTHGGGARAPPGHPWGGARAQRDHRRIRLLIADSLTGDIRGGRDYGTRTGLMLTGITSAAMLAASDHQPELVFAFL